MLVILANALHFIRFGERLPTLQDLDNDSLNSESSGRNRFGGLSFDIMRKITRKLSEYWAQSQWSNLGRTQV